MYNPTDYKILTEYLTNEQLRELRASWYAEGFTNKHPAVKQINKAIKYLEG